MMQRMRACSIAVQTADQILMINKFLNGGWGYGWIRKNPGNPEPGLSNLHLADAIG